MSILGAWTSLADFYPLGGSFINAETTAAQIAPYAKEGVKLNSSTSQIRLLFPEQSEFWFRFHLYGDVFGNSFNTGMHFQFKGTEAGQVLFKVLGTNTNDWILQYWNGSAFTTAATAADVLGVALYKVDVNIKMDETVGFFRIYLNDTLVAEMTGDTIFTAATTLNTVEFGYGITNNNTAQRMVYSGLILADEDTRAMVFHQGQASGAGATTGWTDGDYTDVTKLNRDDNTFIKSETADQVITFAMDDVNIDLASYTPRAVVLSARSRRGVTGPQNLQGVVRQSGSDFTTSNVDGISAAYAAKQIVMNTNPATSSNWFISEIDGNEFGLKSVA